ncbi:MAG TPA: hypothetical protein VF303_04000 [Candidatus Nanoarchaeia archaeon]
MIYLIHGQNQVDSRRFLIRLKSGYQNIEIISGKNLTVKEFQKTLRGLSHHLFGGRSALLIEYFDGNWQVFPRKLPAGVDVILWSVKKIPLSQLRVKSFLFDQIKKPSVFKLSDAVLFKEEKQALITASQLLSTKEPTEKIIGVIARGFYLVYCAKVDSLVGSELPTFAQKKIQEQAKLWSRPSLKRALIYLLGVDLALKEGAKAEATLTTFISRAISF